jgi:2-aminoadipate transaminase
MFTAPVPELRLSQSFHRAADQPIGALISQALANPGLISLAAGFVDPSTLPIEATGELTASIFADPSMGRDALQYGTTTGRPDLRAEIFDRFVRPDFGAECPFTPDNLVITAGSNQLLYLLGESLLDPGDIVIAAAPSYFVFLGTLSQLGAEVVGVEADGDGMDPAALEATLIEIKSAGQLNRLKAIYLVSYFDNPAGSTLTASRRAKIIELAKQYSQDQRIMVISDEAYRPLSYEGDDLASMSSMDAASEFVVSAGTFSKSFSPGIRVGWGLLPDELVDAITAQKNNIDFGSPNLNQFIVQRALQTGRYETHVDNLRIAYRLKRDAMLAALDQYLGDIDDVVWRRPDGGLYVWLTLPKHLSASPASALFHLAVERGVLYVPGQYCFPSKGTAVHENTIRLSFGVESAERIADGIRILSLCIQETLASSD